jgi:hypothetical protein
VSRYTGRRGEPERTKRAALLLACGFSIRRSLRMAGYSHTVANRGTAALRHSQLLQRALFEVLAKGPDLRSLPQAQADILMSLYLANAFKGYGRSLRAIAGAFPGLDFSRTRTEYYGQQRKVVVIESSNTEA